MPGRPTGGARNEASAYFTPRRYPSYPSYLGPCSPTRCSSDLSRQFNTAAFRGPAVNSNGLESGQNYMRGCPDHVWDFAIARNIRLGGGRSFQIRAELFNAFSEVIITDRNSNAQFANLQEPTRITNLPYNADGTPIPDRLRPANAGFGVASNARALRNVQLQVRFQF